MEGELIIVTLISSTFGLIGLMLINRNWFLRQKIKYDYQLKRAKMTKRLSTPVVQEKSGFDTVKDLLPLFKGLDSDQIGALADRFLGGGEELPIESGGLNSILDNIPPELIQSFLKGLTKDKEAPGNDQAKNFESQL